MNNSIKFMVEQADLFVGVRELRQGQHYDEGRHVATFGVIAPLGAGAHDRAVAFASFLEEEHAGGRVAQVRCEYGPCDFDRIHDAAMLTDQQRESIVLCAVHTMTVDARRKR